MKKTVTKSGQKKFSKRFPLIQEEDLHENQPTTEWVTFIDGQGNFLAQGYLGKQNKGIGWLLSFTEEPLNQSFFETIFARAKEKRQPFYQNEETTAFRVLNGEGDQLGGLTVDLYQNYAVFSWYNETLYSKRELLINAFHEIFPEVIGGYEKIRFSSDLPESQHIFGEKAPEPLVIKENGISYAVYLDEGLMTGIFLDQKEVRGHLASGIAAGKTVLNMFSYTGAFSVAAAMGGAKKTTSVDLAKRSLPKTREQFEVNGIDPDLQDIHVMDVFSYFKYARKKELSFDIIVLDPPSFARNKKKVFTVAKNYGELVEDSADILNEKGLLIASTNAANLSRSKFQQIIEDALHKKNVRFKKVAEYSLPQDFSVTADFPEGDYLKVFCYQKTD